MTDPIYLIDQLVPENIHNFPNNDQNNFRAQQPMYSIGFLSKLIARRFSGNRKELNSFIVDCNSAFKLAHPSQKEALMYNVLSKLDDPAKTQLTNTEYDTWEELREKLNSLYKEKRSHAQLLQDLNNIQQGPNEKIPEFYTRLEAALAEVIKEIKEREINPDRLSGAIDNVNDVALNRFVYYSIPMISCVLRWKSPNTLQEAYTTALEEERAMNNMVNREDSSMDRNYQNFYDTLRELSINENNNDTNRQKLNNNNNNRTNNNNNNTIGGTKNSHSNDTHRGYFQPGPPHNINYKRFHSNNNRNFLSNNSWRNTNNNIPWRNNNNNIHNNDSWRNKNNNNKNIVWRHGKNHPNSNIICYTCGKTGHLSPECFHNKARTFAIKTCTFCKRDGHSYEECRKKYNDGNNAKTGQNYLSKVCNYCKKIGHIKDECFKLKNKIEQENNQNTNGNFENRQAEVSNSGLRQNMNSVNTQPALNSKTLPTMVCRSRSFEVHNLQAPGNN